MSQDPVKKPALKLIRSDEPEAEEKPTAKAKSNPFVQFMNAYADAIDSEVETILKL